MSKERRKKSRIPVSSSALAFISHNVTEYAADFSAGILDVCEDGVGIVFIGEPPSENKKYLMSFFDTDSHIENIPISIKYNIPLDAFDSSGNKCGAAFAELTEVQKKGLQSLIERQDESIDDP